MLLAGRCIAECSQISEPLIDNLLDRIYQFWLKYPEAEFIRSVMVAIGQTWMKLVQNLQTALNHEESDVRGKAAAALGQIGSNKAVDALISALNDEDRTVRGKAAATLGQIGSAVCLEKLLQSAVPHLIERLDVFSLARSLAIRFSKAGLPFIPVYPELLPTPAMIDQAEA